MKLTISKGATINLTNYESARVDLSFEAEVDGSPDEIQEIKESFVKTINSWLQLEVERVQTEAGLPPHNSARFTG